MSMNKTPAADNLGVLNDSETRVAAMAETMSNVSFTGGNEEGNSSDEEATQQQQQQQQQQAPAQPKVGGKGRLSKIKEKNKGLVGGGVGGMQGASSRGGAAASPPAYTATASIGGKNIGSGANEPNWTSSDMAIITDACNKRLECISVSETRRSVPDPGRVYVKSSPDGTIMATPNSILPNLSFDMIKLGMGIPRSDEKLQKNRAYADVVCVGKDGSWVLNQWTSMNVVMEGVAESVLNRPPRMVNGRPERKIGESFARFGLPKACFGPIIETLNANIPGIRDSLSVTKGYYWTNASWGVNANPATFAWIDDQGGQQRTQHLPTAMKMIMGGSTLGVATIAISVSSDAKMVNGRMVPTQSGYSFSIKCHNIMHLDKVDFHGPPQSAATGFELTSDIMRMAKPLNKPAITQSILADTSSMFGMPSGNPFAGNTSVASMTMSEKTNNML